MTRFTNNADTGRGELLDASEGTAVTESWPFQPLPTLEQACCCSARPVARVVMPRTDERDPVDLLLCGHHFRESREALRGVGATVYDAGGTIILSEPWAADVMWLLPAEAF